MRYLVSIVLIAVGATVAGADEPAAPMEQAPAEKLFRTAMKFDLSADNTYRNMTLRAALAEDAGFAKAHWALGELSHNGEWTPVSRLIQDSDSVLTHYAERRRAAGGDAEKEFALAKWCRANQLPDREQLHLMRVMFRPQSSVAHRAAVARRLKRNAYNGQWLTVQQLAALQAAEEKSQRDFKEWSPRIAKWRNALDSENFGKRKKAMDQLNQLRDPAAIAALETDLSSYGESYALLAVQALANIPHHTATMSLVRHALAASWPNVVEAAAAELRKRPVHEYVPTLLAQLDTPIVAGASSDLTFGGLFAVQRQFVFKVGMDANSFVFAQMLLDQVVNL